MVNVESYDDYHFVPGDFFDIFSEVCKGTPTELRDSFRPDDWLDKVLGADQHVLSWVMPFGKYRDRRIGDVPLRYLDQTLIQFESRRWIRVIQRLLDLPFINNHCLSTARSASTPELPHATLNDLLKAEYRSDMERRKDDWKYRQISGQAFEDGSLFAFFHVAELDRPERFFGDSEELEPI